MALLKGTLVAGAVAAIGMSAAPTAHALDAIGLNFVATGDAGAQNGTADALIAAESAGATGYEQTNWNNLGRWGQTTALNDSSGGPTLVTATWDSNNTWNNGAGTATPNAKLMHGYLDAVGGANDNATSPYPFFNNVNKPEAFITGLATWLASKGATSYTVVVYTDGDNTAGRTGEYWIQGAGAGDPPTSLGADLTPHVFKTDLDNFSGAFSQIPTAGTSAVSPGTGNYIVFTGLTADSFVLRTEETSVPVGDTAFRAQINGFQIIAEVPEPGSLAFIGLGAGAFLARRRNRAL